MTSSAKKIGQRIVKIRAERNLTQKDFAKKLKTQSSVVSNWECGRNKPNKVMLAKISIMTKIPVEKLTEE